MARPRFIQSGDEVAGARLEFVRTRRVVRLGGWHDRDREIPPVEVPASRFLSELGIGPEELGAVPSYLVLAAVQYGPTPGLRHLAAAFPSELQARQLFLQLRARHQRPGEWAQVVSLDARSRLVPICWFGTPGDLNALRREDAAVQDDEQPSRTRRWAGRRQRG
ncbi:MAG: hypothetical protein ABR540_10160 [Acidimicrobiales bacterium]